VIPRTRAAVPHSTRAGAALLSGGERQTTTERELEWLTRSTRARWLVAVLEMPKGRPWT